MLYLPTYDEIKSLEGQGNYAVKKYYAIPWRWFYRHKLKMVVKLINKFYYRCLDFGAGSAKILHKTLLKSCGYVTCIDEKDVVNPLWRFNLIVCSSVLEFVDLKYTMKLFNSILVNYGDIVVASPMDTWITRLYFKLIGDKKLRNSHHEIFSALALNFDLISYQTWFGLYFSMKVRKKWTISR